MTPEHGILYVGAQDLRFLCEAIASAESARRVLPRIAITLFTDLAVDDDAIAPFDIVRSTRNVVPPDRMPPIAWARGLYVKVVCMARSPYARTVFLDTDTRVRRAEFAQLFDQLEQHTLALVGCNRLQSRSCRMYGEMFNTGMIAYRKDDYSDRLFRDWTLQHCEHLEAAATAETSALPYVAHLNAAARRFVLIGDQTSFARLVNPAGNVYGMSVKQLPAVWNARNVPRFRLRKVIVDHASRHKVLARDVRRFLAVRGLSHLYDPARISFPAPTLWDRVRRAVSPSNLSAAAGD